MKKINRPETQDRAKEFQQWHRTLGRRLLASDVDLVEWRLIDGELVPVGVLEITLADWPPTKPYLDAIIHRYEKKDVQGRTARHVADALGCKAWIVCYTQGCQKFWVWNLTESKGWFNFNAKQMELFLEGLERGIRPPFLKVS
tara:strand:+ start:4522 stop:4950 length:429 start_codon:yes stop_codon:yes gene_type:complete